jgi:uncharacterized protein (TIGR02996 family)
MEQAFLDDILAHPENPALWHILADWLEDRGDPRAELVRVTWSLQHERDHPDFSQRQARVQELLRGGVVPVVSRLQTALGLEFAWIAPGTFLMGSPKGEDRHEGWEAQHPVTLTSGFWMGVYPVTQGQWYALTGNNPSAFSRHGRSARKVRTFSNAQVDRFPVENVSWEVAIEFCAALSARLNRTVRLPTEAEWEYACRAGTTTTFHFGKVATEADANFNFKHPKAPNRRESALERPSVVGSYPPNAWGLYDMHGNVWEWCQDVHQTTAPFPEADNHRALRGGSWFIWPELGRSAGRAFESPDAPDHRHHLGLRVILAVE